MTASDVVGAVRATITEALSPRTVNDPVLLCCRSFFAGTQARIFDFCDHSQASVWCTCGRARSHCMAIFGHLAYPAETRPVHPGFHALSSGASLAANKSGIGDFFDELLRPSLTILGGVCAAMTSAGEGDRDDAEQNGSLSQPSGPVCRRAARRRREDDGVPGPQLTDHVASTTPLPEARAPTAHKRWRGRRRQYSWWEHVWRGRRRERCFDRRAALRLGASDPLRSRDGRRVGLASAQCGVVSWRALVTSRWPCRSDSPGGQAERARGPVGYGCCVLPLCHGHDNGAHWHAASVGRQPCRPSFPNGRHGRGALL
jgi:hypothetical protein